MRVAAVLVAISLPCHLNAQAPTCPVATYGDLSTHPISGDLLGTQITITGSPQGCIALLRIAEGALGPARTGPAMLRADSLTFAVPAEPSVGPADRFEGVFFADSLRGYLASRPGELLTLHRMSGEAPHVHDASHAH